MDDSGQELVRGWVRKARHDLAAARKLATGDDPYLDVAVYHCQQAAEKALKGLMTHHNVRVDKTHDLSALVATFAPMDPRITAFYDEAECLTPYATIFRYPSDAADPDASEFQRALNAAQKYANSFFPYYPMVTPNTKGRAHQSKV